MWSNLFDAICMNMPNSHFIEHLVNVVPFRSRLSELRCWNFIPDYVWTIWGANKHHKHRPQVCTSWFSYPRGTEWLQWLLGRYKITTSLFHFVAAVHTEIVRPIINHLVIKSAIIRFNWDSPPDWAKLRESILVWASCCWQSRDKIMQCVVFHNLSTGSAASCRSQWNCMTGNGSICFGRKSQTWQRDKSYYNVPWFKESYFIIQFTKISTAQVHSPSALWLFLLPFSMKCMIMSMMSSVVVQSHTQPRWRLNWLATWS